MEVSQFKKLLINGFDIEFNIQDVFYSFTKSSIEGVNYYFIGNENYTVSEKFTSIEELLLYKIDDVTVEKIVENISEDEICY